MQRHEAKLPLAGLKLKINGHNNHNRGNVNLAEHASDCSLKWSSPALAIDIINYEGLWHHLEKGIIIDKRKIEWHCVCNALVARLRYDYTFAISLTYKGEVNAIQSWAGFFPWLGN